jgi:hypothetical protein
MPDWISLHEGATVVTISTDNIRPSRDYTQWKMKPSGLLFAVSAAAATKLEIGGRNCEILTLIPSSHCPKKNL